MKKTSILATALSMMAFPMEQAQDGAGTGQSTGTSGNVVLVDPPVPEGMHAEMFHFRKEKVKDAEGNEVGEAFKHPSVKIPLPIPTKEEVLAIMSAPSEGEGSRASEQRFLLDLISDALYSQARDQINAYRDENPKATVTANIIDYSKLSITALANMPASERGNKVSDEDMAAFINDYSAIMPAALNKEAKKIAAQTNILEKGLRTVRTDKKVLDVMKDVLAVWAATTANLEEHQKVYDMLTGRITKWMSAEPKNVLDSIM